MDDHQPVFNQLAPQVQLKIEAIKRRLCCVVNHARSYIACRKFDTGIGTHIACGRGVFQLESCEEF